MELETHHHEVAGAGPYRGQGGRQRSRLRYRRGGDGVVNVMGFRSTSPAVLGKMIGGALVGTFLGILISYGFVAPIASVLEQKAEESSKIYQCIKVVLLASMSGYARRWRSNSAARCFTPASGRASGNSRKISRRARASDAKP